MERDTWNNIFLYCKLSEYRIVCKKWSNMLPFNHPTVRTNKMDELLRRMRNIFDSPFIWKFISHLGKREKKLFMMSFNDYERDRKFLEKIFPVEALISDSPSYLILSGGDEEWYINQILNHDSPRCLDFFIKRKKERPKKLSELSWAKIWELLWEKIWELRTNDCVTSPLCMKYLLDRHRCFVPNSYKRKTYNRSHLIKYTNYKKFMEIINILHMEIYHRIYYKIPTSNVNVIDHYLADNYLIFDEKEYSLLKERFSEMKKDVLPGLEGDW